MFVPYSITLPTPRAVRCMWKHIIDNGTGIDIFFIFAFYVKNQSLSFKLHNTKYERSYLKIDWTILKINHLAFIWCIVLIYFAPQICYNIEFRAPTLNSIAVSLIDSTVWVHIQVIISVCILGGVGFFQIVSLLTGELELTETL